MAKKGKPLRGGAVRAERGERLPGEKLPVHPFVKLSKKTTCPACGHLNDEHEEGSDGFPVCPVECDAPACPRRGKRGRTINGRDYPDERYDGPVNPVNAPSCAVCNGGLWAGDTVRILSRNAVAHVTCESGVEVHRAKGKKWPMAREKPTKVYRSLVVVKVGGVPFDMMRYDSCVPATESDSAKLAAFVVGSDRPEDKVITFRRFSLNPGGPTEARWRSFCCEVLSWEPVDPAS